MKKIIHFLADNSGIRPFKTIKVILKELFDDELYFPIREIKYFLKVLEDRLDMPDVVLINAHGDSDRILLKVRDHFITAISMQQTWLFKHNFVFAISCFTTREFGKSVIDNGAQVYLGFHESIENDFILENNNQEYKAILEKIMRNIYNKCVSYSLQKFVRDCLTAKELKQYMDLYFKRRVGEILDMSVDSINSLYGVSIGMKFEKEIKAIIKLEFINKYNSLSEKLELLGNEHYISWHNIEYMGSGDVMELFEKLEMYDAKYSYYRYFLEFLAYKSLNMHDCKYAFEIFEKVILETGLKDFRPYIFLKERLVG